MNTLVTLALATRMMIETGHKLAGAVNASDGGADVNALAKEYLALYETVKSWRRRRTELPVGAEKHLSPRESRVVSLARDGHRTKEIARMMSISSETVKTHLRNARKKSA